MQNKRHMPAPSDVAPCAPGRAVATALACAGSAPLASASFLASLHRWLHLLCRHAQGDFHLLSLPPLAALQAMEKEPRNVLKYLLPQTAMFAAAVWSYLIKQNTNSETRSACFLPLTGE